MTIWAYEANRLFRDRLVGEETCSKFDNILVTIVRNDWSVNIIDMLASKLSHVLCIFGWFTTGRNLLNETEKIIFEESLLTLLSH